MATVVSNDDDDVSHNISIATEVKTSDVGTIESNYFPKGGYLTTEHKLDPIARILLIGVYDDDHPLSIFRGMRYIVRNIWVLAMQFNRVLFGRYIETVKLEYDDAPKDYQAFHEIDGFQAEGRCGRPQKLDLKFPKPLEKDVNINMMPILMIENEIKKQIPYNLEGYVDWIKACLVADEFKSLEGKICYLTIHESSVQKGKTQRRPGLHTENPGDIGYGIDGEWEIAWGGGYNHEDGIYIASNISGSCVAWNCKILDHKYIQQRRTDIWQKKEEVAVKKEDGEELIVIGNMGDIEHLRGVLPKDRRYELEGGKMYWMTDRTPHEALPMKEEGWRQFFRLVSSKLSVWYQDHSTPNPIGIKPDEKITKIVKGNKFG